MKTNKKQTYGISTSLTSIISHKCSFCKTEISNIRIFSNFKKKFPKEQSTINYHLKKSFFNLLKNTNNDIYKIYIKYKVKNIYHDNALEFIDMLSCKCGKLSIVCNHTEAFQLNNGVTKARRSKKSFSKKMNVSSYF